MSGPTSPPPDPTFDRFADRYDESLQQGLSVSGESKDYFAEQRIRWLAARLNELKFVPQHILDFGCGTGSATPFFRAVFPNAAIVGTDVSTRSIETARKKFGACGAEFHALAGYQPDREFDLAFCNGVFHHIPPADRPQAVDTVARALKPGGWFAFWENNPWNPGTRIVMSRIPFDREAITLAPPEARRLLRASGLQVRRSDSYFYFPRALRALRCLEPALARLPLGAQYLVLAQRPD
ncbi:MAG: methyltransferase domain-containing protein [Kiritimatiellae bacterium]|nr:methyltransferase domain-containing protein [Kiritimatiellia bacterium]MCO5068232.1 methyltransferase domain-containing protein [Kiritimatiellia bacterium]